MKRKIVQLLLDGLYNNEEFGKTADKILSLMGKKELGGSGTDSSNGDLHSVRECNVSGEAESTEVPVNGSLEKRTDTENKCIWEWNHGHMRKKGYASCKGCGKML